MDALEDVNAERRLHSTSVTVTRARHKSATTLAKCWRTLSASCLQDFSGWPSPGLEPPFWAWQAVRAGWVLLDIPRPRWSQSPRLLWHHAQVQEVSSSGKTSGFGEPPEGSYGTKENSTRFGISVSLKPNPVKVRSVQLFDCLLGRPEHHGVPLLHAFGLSPNEKGFMPPLLSDLMLLLLQGACVLNDNKTLSPCFPSPRTIGVQPHFKASAGAVRPKCRPH